ncbi:MAG: hypothetical protein GY810_08550 [Aureispira sp.]|nr:hypothetical protein [Aureispira sp.]
MNKKKSQEEQNKISKKERKEKALDEIFGPNRDEYMGNIWGWKFSFISLFGLLLVGGLAIYGKVSGKIDFEEQLMHRPSEQIQKNSPHMNKPVVKDTLK